MSGKKNNFFGIFICDLISKFNKYFLNIDYILIQQYLIKHLSSKKMSKIILNKAYKTLELIFIGLLIPTLILVYRLAENVILILWLITLYGGFIYLKYHNRSNLKQIMNFQAFTKKNVNIILVRWLLLTIVIYLITFYFYNDKLFTIQKQNPYFLIIIFFVYPILSALPQEFIFTTFFFSRYQNLIPEKLQIFTSAIIFTYAHVLFINFIAPFLSIFGGLIFANTYKKTNSLALVTFEHSLYGNSLFFMGLGYYFWGGSVSIT